MKIVQLKMLTVMVAVTTCCATNAQSENGAAPRRTAFDDYIAKPDPAYRWKIANKKHENGVTVYIIDMVSQRWLDDSRINRPEWQHWLSLAVPDDIAHDKAFLFITGGSNRNPNPPDKMDGRFVDAAKATKSVIAELKMVPNQPLTFVGEEKGRSEDSLIAQAWIRFMDTGDPEYLPRFPMAKSAVRAMDTIQDALGAKDNGAIDVNGFVVAGASKRGWTTWMTAVADSDRVVAIIPIVIDLLNVKTSFEHHYQALGFWAPAIWDYVTNGVMDRQDSKEYDNLLALVDPYSYRHRLTMPKYLVNASQDQFFVPDSSQFYFKDLVGEKYLRYVPNTGHGMEESDAWESILTYYNAILNDIERPEFSWEVKEDGTIEVHVKDQPKEVNLWAATNKARDFRVDVFGKLYNKTTLQDQGGGVYSARPLDPEEGFTAFFVELVYDSGTAYPFKFTTDVKVVPDVLPYTDRFYEKYPAMKKN